jgi:phytanoyl-CoA hydroxylase
MITTTGILSPAQVATYREQGYLHVPALLDAKRVAAVLPEIDAIVAQQLQLKGKHAVPFQDESTLLANMETLLATDVSAYLAAARHMGKLVSIMRLSAVEALNDLGANLGFSAVTMPTSPVLHIQADTLKIPNGYYGVAPHQDWPSIQGALDSITVWTPLMDVSADRFPVEFIPGSHLRGLWPGEVTANALEITTGIQESDWVRVPAKQGDVVIFSTFTVHRTALTGCSGLRIAASNRYENAADPTFVGRGYPCAYKRTVERDFITPDFPAPEQVAVLFS